MSIIDGVILKRIIQVVLMKGVCPTPLSGMPTETHGGSTNEKRMRFGEREF